MRPIVVALPIVLALSCRPAQVQAPVPPPTIAEQQLAQANELARSKEPRRARDLYLKIARDYPTDPAAAEALYALGLLRIEAKGPLRDYSAARVAFNRVVSEHPGSPRAAEARTWSMLLHELQKHEREAARLRGDLERVKALDMELEQRP
jgi:TolA-binding protein